MPTPPHLRPLRLVSSVIAALFITPGANAAYANAEPLGLDSAETLTLEAPPALVPSIDATLLAPGDASDASLPTIDPPSEDFAPEGEIDDAFEDEVTYDVPIVLNETVEDYISYFQTRIKDRFALWLSRSGKYLPAMREIFRQHGLPEDLVYVALIESGFNPYAYSRARAAGAWQFIRSTGKIYGLRIDEWVDERRDPIKATHSAARYLKDLFARFGSWPLALASYNAGENKIERAIARAKTDDYWDIRTTRHIRAETKGYVPKFMAATIIAKDPERFGFTLEYHEPLNFSELSVPGSANMRAIADAAGITYEELKELNPELRTEITPPDVAVWLVKLPSDRRAAFETNYAALPDERKRVGVWHTVRKGETLGGIARKYGANATLLRQVNALENDVLAESQTVFVPKVRVPKPIAKARIVAKAAPSQSVTIGNKIIYRVQPGDTLWEIAKSFSLSVDELKRLNGLRGKRPIIRPGDQLVLGVEGL